MHSRAEQDGVKQFIHDLLLMSFAMINEF